MKPWRRGARPAAPGIVLASTLCAPYAAAGILLLCLSGCGTVGAPLPPSLALPVPVTDLAANRVGDTVHLEWVMPRRTTDKLVIKQPVTVHVCRKLEAGPCVTVGEAQFGGGKPGHFEDVLPAQLTAGPARLLTYTIELRNHMGHAAGPSKAAYSAAGLAPAPMNGLAGEIRADGVLLRWHAASVPDGTAAVSIHRTLIQQAQAKTSKQQRSVLPMGEAPPPEAALLVPFKAEGDPGRALDPSIAFDQSYTYRAERVTELTLNGHPVKIEGVASDAITLATKDVFPPRTPQDLAAVAVTADHAIDLSWTADIEPDLVGYIVYRREAESGPAARISPAAPIGAPAYRDLTAVPGHAYTYSVSAIDQDGNESARSTEVEETLPNAGP